MNLSELQTNQAELPIWQALAPLREALDAHNTALLVAPPGAGKSTIVPLALLDEAWLQGRKILVLEPRRLAARALAWRAAELSQQPLGQCVGLRTRDDSQVSRHTRVEVVTEALLTRRLQSDPELEGVGLVIFDEFHERSLDADLGLALVRDVQAGLRDDLRVLLMSATLEHDNLAARLDAPVIETHGRSYPVDVRYARPRAERTDDGVAAAVQHALAEQAGDILVFLPGEGEIRAVARKLANLPAGTSVHPLYGRLPRAAQQTAIAPAGDGQRKIVLATAVAESSITIAGVRVVIDAGLMRVPVYDPNAGFSHLATRRVSRDAADQRAGRAGRTAPGVCIRLWSSEEVLPAHREPALRSADLSSVALNVAAWGSEPQWLEEPPSGPWAQAMDVLGELDLCDARGRINERGRKVAAWGAHPRIGAMLLAAADEAQRAMACDLAALLESDERTGAGTDIHQRWLAWRRGGMASPQVKALDRDSTRWRKRLGVSSQRAETDAGALLAHGFVDRIAMQRQPGSAQYQLANGRGARLPDNDPLSGQRFLVVADLDGQREARIRLAASLDEAAFQAAFDRHIQWRDRILFNPASGQVECQRERVFRRLILARQPLAQPDTGAVCQALIDGLMDKGFSQLNWSGAAARMRARIACLQGEDWPGMDDDNLRLSLDQWLGPWLFGLRGVGDITPGKLADALWASLSAAQQKRLREQAPDAVSLPSGRQVKLDYAAEDGPVLAVRMQDMYGQDASPQVGGRPVLLHLLSPARRPLAVTRDLASFWRNAWPDVRKQMRGRYPKHEWPERPWEAPALRR